MMAFCCSILYVFVSRVTMPDAKDSRKERRDLQVCGRWPGRGGGEGVEICRYVVCGGERGR